MQQVRRMNKPVKAVRDIIRQVVEQIVARLKPNFVHAVQGRRNRFIALANSQNFDWRRTIQQNLKHYHRPE